MLETALTLAAISGGAKLLSILKQYRDGRRKVKEAEKNINERFSHPEKRHVVRLTLFLTEEEMDVVENAAGEILEGATLTDAEAVAALQQKEKRERGQQKRKRPADQEAHDPAPR